MKEGCLICKAPLKYLEKDKFIECSICHKKENSKARCIKGQPYPSKPKVVIKVLTSSMPRPSTTIQVPVSSKIKICGIRRK